MMAQKIKAACAWMLVIGLLIGNSVYAIDAASFDNPDLQARYLKLTNELRCLQCQNESIADSNATLASDLRRQVREMLEAGKSDKEILKFLTDRYGDFVLYQPPFAARTMIVWLAPGLFLLVALISVVVVVRGRAQQPVDDDSTTASGDVK